LIWLRERAAAPARAEEGREPAAAPPHLIRPGNLLPRGSWPAAGKKSKQGRRNASGKRSGGYRPSPHLPNKLPRWRHPPTRQLGTEGEACFGAARTERCARVCDSDAEASSTGNARRPARSRACVRPGTMEMESDAKNAARGGQRKRPRARTRLWLFYLVSWVLEAQRRTSPGHAPESRRRLQLQDAHKEVSSSTSLDGS
jgi:hypothetical protein